MSGFCTCPTCELRHGEQSLTEDECTIDKLRAENRHLRETVATALPVFTNCAAQVRSEWIALLHNSGRDSTEIEQSLKTHPLLEQARVAIAAMKAMVD